MRPPGWAERLVERTARGTAAGPSMAGDLREEWARVLGARGVPAARRWYVRQALAIASRYAVERVGRAVGRFPDAALSEVRHAARGLRRSPGFTLVAVFSLGGGLGLTTVVFSVVNALWLAPPPWPDGARLVDVGLDHPTEVCEGCSVGAPFSAYLAWAEQDFGMEALGAVEGFGGLLTGTGAAERVRAQAISREVASLLGIRPEFGRLFTADEHTAAGGGAGAVTVLSHGLWVRRFGGDPSVLGSRIELDGESRTVVGVLTADAALLDPADLWVPAEPRHVGATVGDGGVWVFGRLGEGVVVDAVRDRMTASYQSLVAETPGIDARWSVELRPMRSTLVSDLTEPTLAVVFLSASGLVLLIASLNLASLLLARVTERAGEIRLRAALGASSSLLARRVLVETGLVALAGALVGVGVTAIVHEVVMRSAASVLPPWLAIPIDGRVWLVALGAAVIAAVGCALAPAARAASANARGILPSAPTLREGRVIRRQRLLLVGQLAVGLALVAGTAASAQAYRHLADFDTLGYRTDGIGGPVVDLAGTPHRDPGARAGYIARMSEALTAHPAVSAVVAESEVFLGSWGAADGPSPVQIEGRPEPVPDLTVPRHSLAVGPGYFEMFEIPIVRGRGIQDSDRWGDAPAAVVNRETARLLWPDSDPIGERFTVDNGVIEGAVTVVGIAEDVVINPRSSSRLPAARIYFSLGQVELSSVRFRALTAGEGLPENTWRALTASVDPLVPVTEVITVEGELRRWIGPVAITAALMGALGGTALLLLALGVSGTLAYQVAAGAREIGVRRALGASGPRLVRETVAQVGTMLWVGIALGGGLSVLSARLIGGGGGVQVGSSDPAAIAIGLTVVLASAGLAALAPLIRALKVDPVETLRAD